MKQKLFLRGVFSTMLSIFMLSAVIANDLIKTEVIIEIPVQSEESDEEGNESYITEFSSEVVIPSHAFDFGSAETLLPRPEIKFISHQNEKRPLTKPVFINSYFERIFELLIATNAP